MLCGIGNGGEVEISVDQIEIYADGLDHPEDLAFDREGVLWAGGELGLPSPGERPCRNGYKRRRLLSRSHLFRGG